MESEFDTQADDSDTEETVRPDEPTSLQLTSKKKKKKKKKTVNFPEAGAFIVE